MYKVTVEAVDEQVMKAHATGGGGGVLDYSSNYYLL
jgi:hypothetical protein